MKKYIGRSMHAFGLVLALAMSSVFVQIANAGLVWSKGSYSTGSWTPAENNLLLTATCGTSNLARLTDGKLERFSVGSDGNIENNQVVYWTLANPAFISAVNIYSWWNDSGRDGINVQKIEVKVEGSDTWTNIGASAVTQDGNTGANFVKLTDSGGGELVSALVTALRITFGTQDNSKTCYPEIELVESSWEGYDNFRVKPLPTCSATRSSPAEPEVLVTNTVDGILLEAGVDYKVTYSNNLVSNHAYAVVKGIGDYAGNEVALPYTIVHKLEISDFDTYMSIAPTPGKVSSTLANFPVLVRLSSSRQSGFDPADCGANGEGLRFMLADGTMLAHEIDYWNPEGESTVWVNVPSLTADTTIYALWSPKSGYTPPACPTSETWPDYIGVWHMNLDGNKVYDSSGNDYSATNAAATAASSPKIGQAASSSTRFLSSVKDLFASSASKKPTSRSVLTFSAWGSMDSSTGDKNDTFSLAQKNGAWNDGTGGFICDYMPYYSPVYFRMFHNSGTGSSSIQNSLTVVPKYVNVWKYFTCTVNGATANQYIDGSNVGTIDGSHGILGPDVTGILQFGPNGVSGRADEIRIRNGVASAAWILADYQNQATTTFISYGPIGKKTFGVAAVSEQAIATVATAAEPKPAVTCDLSGDELVEGADYELSYLNNTFGSASGSVIVTGLGAYEGCVVTNTFAPGLASADLAADADWTAYAAPRVASSATIDLKGHTLTLSSLASGGTITDSVGGGKVVFDVPAGKTATLNTALTGKLKLVKQGAGVLSAAYYPQTYTGGNDVLAGVLRYGRSEKNINSTDKQSCFGAYGYMKIYVGPGAVIDPAGSYLWGYHSVALDGGSVSNTVVNGNSSNSNGFNANISTTGDVSFVTMQNYRKNGGATDLHGATMTFENYNSSTLDWGTPLSNGTLAFTRGGWFVTYASIDMSTVDFIQSGGALNLANAMSVRDYYCSYASDYASGSAALNVYGTFTPASTYFYGPTMQDGSAIDISAKSAAWSTTSPNNGHHNGNKTVKFAAGATVMLKLGEREIASGDKLVSWSAKPSASFAFDGKYAAVAPDVRDDGVYMGLREMQISAIAGQFLENHRPVMPRFSVTNTVTGVELEEGVDYTVSYEGNGLHGTAYAVATGINSYEGIVCRRAFEITEKLVLTDFGFRIAITPAAGKVTAAHTNFPVLVRLSSALQEGFDPSLCGTDGAGIRFALEDGTILPHEVDLWNAEGESTVWVGLPVLDADSKFYMYYALRDGLSAPHTDGAPGVWIDYTGVWHMSEASGTVADSTGHGLTATPKGGYASTDCIGFDDVGSAGVPVGRCRRLASSERASYLSVPNYNGYGLGNTFVISGWFYSTSASSGGYPARFFSRKKTWNEENGFETEMSSSTALTARGSGSSGGSVTFPNMTVDWFSLVLVFDGAKIYPYVNGVAKSAISTGAAKDNGYTLSIGNDSDGNERNFIGYVDEVRLSDGSLSAARIAADYAMATDGAFLSFSEAEKLASSFTIDAIPDAYYRGTPVEPSVVVRDTDGNPLAAGVDYAVAYENNAGVGIGGAVVTGLGEYEGDESSMLFNILAGVVIEPLPEQGGVPTRAVEPDVVATDAETGASLVRGVDYSLSYVSNTVPGTATGTYTGLGGYAGYSDTFEFDIHEIVDVDCYDFRMRIEPAAGKVAGALTNFPVVVRLSAALQEGFDPADCGDGGVNLRFASPDWRPLAHEIESWDPEGESVVWVKLPELTTNTVFYALAAPRRVCLVGEVDPTAVWDGYVGVWHMSEAGGSASDSTANALTLGATASSASFVARDGMVGNGRYCPKNVGFERAHSAAMNCSGVWSYGGWAKLEATSGVNCWFIRKMTYSTGSASRGASLKFEGFSSGTAQVKLWAGSVNWSPHELYSPVRSITNGVWHHIMGVVNASRVARIYIDGKLSAQTTMNSNGADNSSPLDIAGYYEYAGMIDEIRMRHTELSAGWVAAEYANQRDAEFFVYTNETRARFSASPVADQVVAGDAVAAPEVVVSNLAQGVELVRGVDYSVAFTGLDSQGLGSVTITGLGEYSDYSRTMDFKVTRLSKGVALPAEYRQASYVQGDGTAARIVTEYTPAPQTDSIDALVEITDDSKSGAVFCARGASTATSTYTLFYDHPTDGFWFHYATNTLSGYVGSGSVLAGRECRVSVATNTASVSGAGLSDAFSHDPVDGFASAGNALSLFCSYVNGTGSSLGNYSSHKLYSFTVTRNGALFRDYTPCVRRIDGVAGLYERVTERFYPNTSSTGAITAGEPMSALQALPPGWQGHTGSAVEPDIAVIDAATGAMVDPALYTVAYSDNVTPGVAKALVTGREGSAYEGCSSEAVFRILPVYRVSAYSLEEEGDGLSWESPMSLTNALSAITGTGGALWLKAGTYQYAASSPTVSTAAPLSILGGFSGDEASPDERGGGARSVLYGGDSRQLLRLSNGRDAPVVVDSVDFVRGSRGINKDGSGSLEISNCGFLGNGRNSSDDGRGVYLVGNASITRVAVSNCVFAGSVYANGGGVGTAIYAKNLSRLVIDDSAIVTNGIPLENVGGFGVGPAEGVALLCDAAPVTMRGTRIAGNMTVLHNGSGGNVGSIVSLRGNCGGSAFTNCAIVGNSVLRCYGGSPSTANGSAANSGVFAVNLGAVSQTVDFKNCTIAYNMGTDTANGSCLTVNRGTISVSDSILWGNFKGNTGSAYGSQLALLANGRANMGCVCIPSTGVDSVTEATAGSVVWTGEPLLSDPLFVTASNDVAALVVADTGSFRKFKTGSEAALASIDVHLLSTAGYWLNDGSAGPAASATSPAVDAGDVESDCSREPNPNGLRVNLGAFGNTTQASLSPVGVPRFNSVSVSYPNGLTRPLVELAMGLQSGDGYIAEVTVYCEAHGQVVAERTFTGVQPGDVVSFYVPQYFDVNTHLNFVCYARTLYGATADTETSSDASGVKPAWVDRGGGDHVIHVREGADCRMNGSNWVDAFPDLASAFAAAEEDATKTEIWVAKATDTFLGSVTFPGPMTVRGGFAGDETDKSQRPEGARLVLDNMNSLDGLSIVNGAGAPVEFERIDFRRATERALRKTGAGDFTLTSCGFYGNSVGNKGAQDGRCVHATGAAGSSRLVISNCVFAGSRVWGGGTSGKGSGLYARNFARICIDDSLFVTNGHSIFSQGGAYPSGAGSAAYVVDSPVTARRCKFLGNVAVGCAAANSGSGGTFVLDGSCGGSAFTNCLWAGNSDLREYYPASGSGAVSGGALWVKLAATNQTVDVKNCTFAYNLTQTHNAAGGINVWKGAVKVRDSIVYFNPRGSTAKISGDDVSVGADGHLDMAYTCVTATNSSSVSSSSASHLRMSHMTTFDPLFVTTSNEVASLIVPIGSKGEWRSFQTAEAYLRTYASFNCHLRGSEGYVDETTGGVVVHRRHRSPAVDAGDPESDFSGEYGSNGMRVNLGAYGNTPWATQMHLSGTVLRLR